MLNTIFEYFKALSDTQKNQLAQLEPIYKFWNNQINVVSRKDIDNLYDHHVLHSLAIAKFVSFKDSTRIMDYGTGGGFPGIPLAIMYPNCQFNLVDSVGKKLIVTNAVVKELSLKNVNCYHMRAEQIDAKYDFVVARAVAKTEVIWPIVKDKLSAKSINDLPNGLLYLKGDDDVNILPKSVVCKKWLISQAFIEPYFTGKALVLLSKSSKI
ncbi:MAG: 16S rRNA (guanine(527)-N(7))-methyltransferase RsmG [Candidatus Saccharibacteria bacterium]